MSHSAFEARLVRLLEPGYDHLIAGNLVACGATSGEVVEIDLENGAATQLIDGLGQVLFLASLNKCGDTILVATEDGRLMIFRSTLQKTPWIESKLGCEPDASETWKPKFALANDDIGLNSPLSSQTRFAQVASHGFVNTSSLAVTDIDLRQQGMQTSIWAEVQGPIVDIILVLRLGESVAIVAKDSNIIVFTSKGPQCQVACVGVGAVVWFQSKIYTLSSHHGQLSLWSLRSSGKRQALTQERSAQSSRSLSQDNPCTDVALYASQNECVAICIFGGHAALQLIGWNNTLTLHLSEIPITCRLTQELANPDRYVLLVNNTCLYILSPKLDLVDLACLRLPDTSNFGDIRLPEKLKMTLLANPKLSFRLKVDPLGIVCERSGEKLCRIAPWDDTGEILQAWDWIPSDAQDAALLGNGTSLAILCGTCPQSIKIFTVPSGKQAKCIHLQNPCKNIFRSLCGQLGILDEPNTHFFVSEAEDELAYFELRRNHIYRVSKQQNQVMASAVLIATLPNTGGHYSLVGVFSDYFIYAQFCPIHGIQIHFRSIPQIPDAVTSGQHFSEEATKLFGPRGVTLAPNQERLFSVPISGDFLPEHFFEFNKARQPRTRFDYNQDDKLTMRNFAERVGLSSTCNNDGTDLPPEQECFRDHKSLQSEDDKLVGYWRFCNAETFDLTGKSTLIQPLLKTIKLIDNVVNTCTGLDAGDGEVVPYAQSAVCPLILSMPDLSERQWTLEFWFKVEGPAHAIIKGLVSFSPQGVTALDNSWHHIACSVQIRNPRRIDVIMCLLDGRPSGEELIIESDLGTHITKTIELFPREGNVAAYHEAIVTEVRVWNCLRSRFETNLSRCAALKLAETPKHKMKVRIN